MGGKVRIGVCWMLTPDDGRSDGEKLGYLKRPDEHRRFDPELFDLLAHVAAEPDRRRLKAIEASGAIPGAAYHNDLLSDAHEDRQSYLNACASEFDDAELVFFDPDNGLEIALPKGRKNSNKFVYLDELASFHRAGKSLLVYQHFPRVERLAFIATCADRLGSIAPDAALWTFSTAHVVFLLLVHPESRARLPIAAMETVHRWDKRFIHGEYMGVGGGGSRSHDL